MKIAFLGLGIMGSLMAKSLHKNGADITTWNRSQVPETNLPMASDLESAVSEADIVFTMVSTPEAVTNLAWGDKEQPGFVRYMKPDSIWVNSSTVDPQFNKTALKQSKKSNIRFIEAPVAGSKTQAEEAALVFFIGGETQALEEATPFINMMGSKIIPMGEVGNGSAIKLIINNLLAQSMLAFSENVALGESMGLDREMLLNLLPKLPVSAPFLSFKSENIKKEAYPTEFPLEWMHKDLHLATKAGYEMNISLPGTNMAKEIYAKAKQSGLAREDFSSVYNYFKQR